MNAKLEEILSTHYVEYKAAQSPQELQLAVNHSIKAIHHLLDQECNKQMLALIGEDEPVQIGMEIYPDRIPRNQLRAELRAQLKDGDK
jgi:hypothetical protein